MSLTPTIASLISIGVSHSVTEDCSFAGYNFKKGFVVVANLYGVHHDIDIWGNDVDQFKPERFLDSTGTKVLPKEALMPFSAGKRLC